MKSGIIYIIKNKVNKKVYIGQTTNDVQTRFKQHCKNSTLKTRNYKLYNAIKKYGKSNFYVEILEKNIDIKELDKKEIYYIEKHNSYKQGYNSTKGGDGRTINKKYDEEKIVLLYQQGKSLTEIANLYLVSYATISRVLKKLDIPTRHDGNKYEQIDKNEFSELWKNKDFTIQKMALKYNVNEKTIRRLAKRLKLNRKGVSTIEKYQSDMK